VLKSKASYKAKLENKLHANDIKGVWRGLQDITDYKIKHHVLVSDPSLPGRFNDFYCRFDSGGHLPPPAIESRRTLHPLSLSMMLESCSVSRTPGRRQSLMA